MDRDPEAWGTAGVAPWCESVITELRQQRWGTHIAVYAQLVLNLGVSTHFGEVREYSER